MAQPGPHSIAIKCPECGKRALVRKVTSTPELDLTIDLVTECQRGLQGMQISECRSMKLIFTQAERRLRAANSS
jgi:DNA-directed RNA polymerase subunit RPC12/RpoP